jgi:hypothetical protein
MGNCGSVQPDVTGHFDFQVRDGYVTAVWCKGGWHKLLYSEFMHTRTCQGCGRDISKRIAKRAA